MDFARESLNYSRPVSRHVPDNNESSYDATYKVRRKRKDGFSGEYRKSYPMRRRTLDSSSSSQVVDDDNDSTDHEQPKRAKVAFSLQSGNDTTLSSIDEDRRQESENRSAEQKSESDEDPNAGNRLWRLELSRADMEKFSDIESKLFRRLLKKILKNNGSAFAPVSSEQPPAETAVPIATNKEEPLQKRKHAKSSKSHGAASPAKRVKRKRKVITRKDKNGVIIEKVYKPYEGEEEKGDIIVKYVNGQPVGSVNSLDLEEALVQEKEKLSKNQVDAAEVLSNHDESTASKDQDPVPQSSNDKLELISKNSLDDKPGDKTGDMKDISESRVAVAMDIIPSCESGNRDTENSMSEAQIYQSPKHEVEHPPNQVNMTCTESAVATNDHEKPLVSTEAGVEANATSNPEEIVRHIKAEFDESELPATSEIPGDTKVKVKRKPMVSARTKLMANRKERGPLIDFNYFQSSAGGSSSCKLLQYLMHCQKEKATDSETNSQDTNGYLDPYHCLNVIESVLKKKPYRDELSSSSDEENGNHEAQLKIEPSNVPPKNTLNQSNDQSNHSSNKSGPPEKAGELDPELTADASKVTTTGKKTDSKKAKGRKMKKKKSHFDPGLASDDEKDRSIVDKLVKKFKVEKDDDDKSGIASRATLKLTHPLSEMLNEQGEKDFSFEVTYPAGAERSSHVLQFELSNNYFSSPVSAELCARITELEVNLNNCIVCSEPATKEKGVLYGPYNFKRELLEMQEQSGTSDVLSVWIHEECALSSPNVCLVGSRLLGLQELVEARLDPVRFFLLL